ncbi:hypothetical protein BDN72DRAFT_904413 [Pluteus cervinus]|uniref:Uncharacterized protein n=1 Tax=Pluteus cervinus TaxID=181527 RepID=A0ACD3A6R3_9AGAR|nr:hypothetical protein BDN72DRAFT_904413 [Pluteus cervinus]
MSDSDEAHSSQEDSVDLEDPTSMSPEVLHVALQRSNADRARLKRKLAIVEDDLVTLRGAKAKIDIPSGRGIPKLVSLYETIDDNMVPEADRRTLKRPDPKFDALNEAEKQIVQRTRDRTFTGYKLLIRLIPGLVDRLCDETVDEVALAALFKQLHSEAERSEGLGLFRPSSPKIYLPDIAAITENPHSRLISRSLSPIWRHLPHAFLIMPIPSTSFRDP